MKPIELLKLNSRTYYMLLRNNIDTVEQLKKFLIKGRITDLKGGGVACAKDVKLKLKKYNK